MDERKESSDLREVDDDDDYETEMSDIFRNEDSKFKERPMVLPQSLGNDPCEEYSRKGSPAKNGSIVSPKKTKSNAVSANAEHSLSSLINQEDGKTPGLVLVSEKAGMKGLDFTKINKIISDNSEGSKFYEHKKKSQERLNRQVEGMLEKLYSFSELEIQKSQKEVDKMAALMELTRDTSRIMVHIDMDCFFAAVEMRDNPSLKDKPMAVGGMSMLSTSNYIARKFGVRAAMPGFLAKKLCPDLVIVPCNYDKYSQVSEVAHLVYKEYDPHCYSSMDEASLDLTDYVQQNTNTSGLDEIEHETKVQEIVEEIRGKVFAATQLTCSAGIAPNSFLAKIGSDYNKPNGQHFLRASDVKNFLATLPIRKVNGIGSVTETMLKGLEIQNCSDIWKKRGAVNLLFKPATVDFLIRVSLGIGSHSFAFDSSAEERKSLSCERTFQETSNYAQVEEYCHQICTEICSDLKLKNIKGKAVAVKIKAHTYEVKTRIRSLLDYTWDFDIISTTAMSIFDSLRKEHPGVLTLRLFGVRISNFKFLKQKNEGAETSQSDEIVGLDDAKSSNIAGSSNAKALVQPRIDKTVWNAPKESEPCPVCFETFSSTLKLLSHVDMCLQSGSPENAQESLPNKDEEGPSSSSLSTCSGLTATNYKRSRLTESEECDDPKIRKSTKQVKMMPISSYFKPLGSTPR